MRHFVTATLFFFFIAPQVFAQTPQTSRACPVGYYCTGSFDQTTGACNGTCATVGSIIPGVNPNPTAPNVCPAGYLCNGTFNQSTGACNGTCSSPGSLFGGNSPPTPGNNIGPGSGPPTPGNNTGGGSLLNPLSSGTDLSSFLTNILNFVIQIGTIVVMLMVVYVGFLFVTARGESGKITAAREALLWTLIGALILLGSKAISLGIQSTVSAFSGGSSSSSSYPNGSSTGVPSTPSGYFPPGTTGPPGP